MLAGAMSILIRGEVSGDAQSIQAVTATAFSQARHTSHTEQYIVNVLRKTGQLAVSLVAEADGIVIGHVAVSPVSISDGAPGWFGIGPISVLPQHRRRGIGAQLMRDALGLLRRRGASGCVVLGEPGYYRRFGFLTDSNLVLPGVPPEYFQVLSFAASKPRGIVTYHEAFSAQS